MHRGNAIIARLAKPTTFCSTRSPATRQPRLPAGVKPFAELRRRLLHSEDAYLAPGGRSVGVKPLVGLGRAFDAGKCLFESSGGRLRRRRGLAGAWEAFYAAKSLPRRQGGVLRRRRGLAGAWEAFLRCKIASPATGRGFTAAPGPRWRGGGSFTAAQGTPGSLGALRACLAAQADSPAAQGTPGSLGALRACLAAQADSPAAQGTPGSLGALRACLAAQADSPAAQGSLASQDDNQVVYLARCYWSCKVQWHMRQMRSSNRSCRSSNFLSSNLRSHLRH